MTTITYRDGVMACDGRMTMGSRIMASAKQKIHRLKNGDLIGIAGNSGEGKKLIDYYNADPKPEYFGITEDTAAIIVRQKTGQVMMRDHFGEYIMKEPYYTIGSGAPFASTAMALGLSAVDAVKIAMKHDLYSGGKVRNLKLKSPTAKKRKPSRAKAR